MFSSRAGRCHSWLGFLSVLPNHDFCLPSSFYFIIRTSYVKEFLPPQLIFRWSWYKPDIHLETWAWNLRQSLHKYGVLIHFIYCWFTLRGFEYLRTGQSRGTECLVHCEAKYAAGNKLNLILAANFWNYRKVHECLCPGWDLSRACHKYGTEMLSWLRGLHCVRCGCVCYSYSVDICVRACGRLYLERYNVDIATRRQDLGFAPETVSWHETLSALKFLAQHHVLYFVSSFVFCNNVGLRWKC